jgi:hypothetical protein
MSSYLDTIQLPDDTREAFLKIAGYLRTQRRAGRFVFDNDAPPPREPVGFWQTTEWLDGLLHIAGECERLAAAIPDDLRSHPRGECPGAVPVPWRYEVSKGTPLILRSLADVGFNAAFTADMPEALKPAAVLVPSPPDPTCCETCGIKFDELTPEHAHGQCNSCYEIPF